MTLQVSFVIWLPNPIFRKSIFYGVRHCLMPMMI